MHDRMNRWILAISIAGMDIGMVSEACDRPGPVREINQFIRLSPGRLHSPLAYSTPNPSPVDVGKGIEAKLDQLLDAIKSLTLDALKAAYFQGALHGAVVTSLIFTILIAFTRKGAP